MAKGNKTGGKDFEPGRSGNPNGRPRLPEDLREARALNKTEFERILNLGIHLTAEELKNRLEAKGTPTIELMVLKIIAAAVNRGDEKRLGFILDRLIGPVPKSVDLSANENSGFKIVIDNYIAKPKEIEGK